MHFLKDFLKHFFTYNRMGITIEQAYRHNLPYNVYYLWSPAKLKLFFGSRFLFPRLSRGITLKNMRHVALSSGNVRHTNHWQIHKFIYYQ